MAGNYWFEVRLNAACWLLENALLTSQQITEYLAITDERLERLQAGELDFTRWPGNPIARKWLSQDDIDRAQHNPTWPLPISPSKDPRIELDAVKPTDRQHENETFYGAQVVRTFFISYGRNAWHTTWVNQFYRRRSVWLTLVAAQEEAEKWRKQGSVVRIIETPALALLSNQRSVVLVEVNPGPQLANLANHDREASVSDLMQRAFELPSDTVAVLATSDPITFFGTEKVHAGKLLIHTAVSRGHTLRLGWQKRPYTGDDLPAVRKLARRMNSRFSHATVTDGGAE